MDTGNNTAGKTAPERYVSEKALSLIHIFIQAQTEDLVSVRALKNFAGKINRQGKTSCDYIHMIGTKHEIYGSRGKILEKYWGYIFTFLDDTENDIDHR